MNKSVKKIVQKRTVQTKKQVKRKLKKNKRKLKYINILVFLVIVVVLTLFINIILNIKISNIYITGNSILKDQMIIEESKLDDYPKSLSKSTVSIKNSLKLNPYIKLVKVEKKWLKEVYIEITERKALFYKNGKLVLEDNKEVNDKQLVPELINYVPDTIYDEFVKEMAKINTEILGRISEIKYNPNEIDQNRFMMTMSDGNYVYLTLNKFEVINNYVEMIKKFKNKKGILYLDSGEYFEIYEN